MTTVEQRDVVATVREWVEREVYPVASQYEHADEFPEPLVEGMKTTVPLHQRIVRDPELLAGDYTIKWLEAWLERNPE